MMIWMVVDTLRGSSVPNFDVSLNGNAMIGAVLFSYPVILGLMVLLIRSHRGLSVASYLGWYGWRSISGKAMGLWIGGVIGLMVVFVIW